MSLKWKFVLYLQFVLVVKSLQLKDASAGITYGDVDVSASPYQDGLVITLTSDDERFKRNAVDNSSDATYNEGDLSGIPYRRIPYQEELAPDTSDDEKVKRNYIHHRSQLSKLLSQLESKLEADQKHLESGTSSAIFPRSSSFKKPKDIPWLERLVDGTTKNLKDLFIGRCFEYMFQRSKHGNEVSFNCDKLWSLFHRAFAYKGPCDVTAADYIPFLQATEESLPKNKALLWSGTRELAHKLSDFKYTKRFTTLEDTIAGYMLAGLTWCGSKSPPGISYDKCPWECGIQAPYWAAANLKFSEKMRGIVHIILNGTRQHWSDKKIWPSYMKSRYYLGPYVIPHLNQWFVTEVRIVVAHTLKLKHLEHCGTDSVKQLHDDISKKGIHVICYDDPQIIRHILCIDSPKSQECQHF